jgi:hypothetical protein
MHTHVWLGGAEMQVRQGRAARIMAAANPGLSEYGSLLLPTLAASI